jgi:hypothetical protein
MKSLVLIVDFGEKSINFLDSSFNIASPSKKLAHRCFLVQLYFTKLREALLYQPSC